MNGLHLIGDWYGCRCGQEWLKEEGRLRDLCVRACKEAGLTVLGDYFFQFLYDDGTPAGVTGAVVLAESHLAIHTWPEDGNVTLDVYVCNYSRDNSARAEAVYESLLHHFNPMKTQCERVQRGDLTPAVVAERVA
ncbi:MAG: adenosylmethionine decarboxylase [Hydrogenophilus sp.]|nr:adenosylmethionine decarboxylase [Hydrogenophilus sp.]